MFALDLFWQMEGVFCFGGEQFCRRNAMVY